MNASPSLYVPTGPGVPGTTGTPTFIASGIEHQEGANEYTKKKVFTQGPCLGFITKSINYFRRRTDKGNTSLFDLSREFGIFGQETITALLGFGLAVAIQPDEKFQGPTPDGSCQRHAPVRF